MRTSASVWWLHTWIRPSEPQVKLEIINHLMQSEFKKTLSSYALKLHINNV